MDFFVLDMMEDKEVPFTLKCPFLTTSKDLIDIHKGTLAFRVGHEEIKFILSSTCKVFMKKYECFRIEIIDESLSNFFSEPKLNDFEKVSVEKDFAHLVEQNEVIDSVEKVQDKIELNQDEYKNLTS